MKPKTDVVMANIIQQIKEAFPFEMSEEEMCAQSCSHGCPKTLLEYIHLEITEWQQRLEKGERPNLGDIQRLSKTSRKIYAILEKNNLIKRDGTLQE